MEALVQMTGHVGTEVDIRGNGSVTAVPAGLYAAGPGKGGEYSDGNTTWIDVTCFRSLAAHVACESCARATPVIVIGSSGPASGPRTARPGSGWAGGRAVGHDLSRGTAIFRKSVRPSAEPPTRRATRTTWTRPDRRPRSGARKAEEAAQSVRAA
jgi:single-strand DNA-binding protein